ncbi:MAG: class I SAM-dependent methyltransferase, partial [Betaproteobacteria bacterium]|nr:class I SAM-dependent methyltransferase [Betaproteobacteria bacterium]
MTAQNFHFGTHPLIESLQVYTAQLADEFQKMWQQDIDYIRFEWVSLPDEAENTLSIDFTLRSADKRHILIILGILVKKDEIHFPSILKNWEQGNISFLYNVIKSELTKPAQNREIRPLSPAPLAPSEITIERTVPGLWFYATVVQHIKRYKFILDFIRPGKILECACGAGYGAVILSRLDTMTEYYGVDLSETAVTYSKASTWDKRFDFHEIDLAEPTPSLYENVISLETIEHVPNPYRFMELLIDKMSP